MNCQTSLEEIAVCDLLEKVRLMHTRRCRLVQVSTTRLADQFEITYSFEDAQRLENLRVVIPASDPRLPSISGIYWCAFLYENEMHDLFEIHVEGISVDFKGNLYQTTVPFAFATPSTAIKVAATSVKQSAESNGKPLACGLQGGAGSH